MIRPLALNLKAYKAGLNRPEVTTLYGLVGRPLAVILTNGSMVSVRWDCARTRRGHMGRTAIVIDMVGANVTGGCDV